MAGHSHWAGIKHKKGRADKERSKIFSKLSREITVAAKLGEHEWKCGFIQKNDCCNDSRIISCSIGSIFCTS